MVVTIPKTKNSLFFFTALYINTCPVKKNNCVCIFLCELPPLSETVPGLG